MKNKIGNMNIGIIGSSENKKSTLNEFLKMKELMETTKIDIELLEKYEKLDTTLLEKNNYLEESNLYDNKEKIR